MTHAGMTGSRVRAVFLAVSLALTSLLAVMLTSQAHAATPEGAVISNGTVQLGVTELGSLNYDCAGNADSGCPAPSATEGVEEVGLRFVPLNIDSTSPGCLCEGWGIADATSGLTGFANEAAGDANLTVDSFTSPSADRAICTVTVSDPALPGSRMRVTQDYQPSTVSPNIFIDTVTVTNTGTNPLNDLRYRRVMDWDIEPTAFDEYVTSKGTSAQLLFNSDDGFASSDPLSSRGPTSTRRRLRT